MAVAPTRPVAHRVACGRRWRRSVRRQAQRGRLQRREHLPPGFRRIHPRGRAVRAVQRERVHPRDRRRRTRRRDHRRGPRLPGHRIRRTAADPVRGRRSGADDRATRRLRGGPGGRRGTPDGPRRRPGRPDRLRHRPRRAGRRPVVCLRRHRRTAPARRGRCRSRHPRGGLPQPDPAVRRHHLGAVRTRPREPAGLRARRCRSDRAQRPEPGHHVHPGVRCRHRLRTATGLPVPRGTATAAGQVRRDAQRAPRFDRADRCVRRHSHPRRAVPAAVGPELQPRSRPGGRHRHRDIVPRVAHLPARSARAARPRRVLAHPPGLRRERRCRRHAEVPQGVGPGGRLRRVEAASHLDRVQPRARRLRPAGTAVQGERCRVLGSVPPADRFEVRPGGAR